MDFVRSVDEIAGFVARVLRAELHSEENEFFFRLPESAARRELVISKDAIEGLITRIQTKSLSDETALYDETSFEVIVQEESPLPVRRLREDSLRVRDLESSLTYEISPPSDEYLIWLLAKASEKNSLRDVGLGFFPRYRAERVLMEETVPGALDFLRAVSSRYLTLKVIADTRQPLRKFSQSAYAFLFHLAYNLDIALVPIRFFEEISRRGRISRMRRSRVDELDPPRRTYNEDLVNHYILAVSTDSPTVQFLSHYHVLEHFFESVFNDDLIEQIKTAITHPGFSYKRKKDVSQLISTITKTLQIRSETITFSESDALRLSLIRFVDVSELTNRLEEYDASLIDYYRDVEVPFSKGATVDLRNGDRDRVVRDLTRRIYATRNALVHSKDGDKARYTPFKDERALVIEIPLMRFISEMVILSASEVM